MSFSVTRIVRTARLPRTLKQRPELKAVLLALADRCNDDGRDAWPSVATIAGESEMSARTVDKMLSRLRAQGLIVEQAAARQHRPRTWSLNLAALLTLSGSQHVASLGSDHAPADPQHAASLCVSDPQEAATLTPSPGNSGNVSDPQNRASDPQNENPGSQESTSRLADGCDRTVLLEPSSLNGPQNGIPATSSPTLSPEERKGEYQKLVILATRLFEAQTDLEFTAACSKTEMLALDHGVAFDYKQLRIAVLKAQQTARPLKQFPVGRRDRLAARRTA